MENFIFCAVNAAGFYFAKPDNPLLPSKKCYPVYFEMSCNTDWVNHYKLGHFRGVFRTYLNINDGAFLRKHIMASHVFSRIRFGKTQVKPFTIFPEEPYRRCSTRF